MLQDQVLLRFGDEAYIPVNLKLEERSTCHSLLLSRASPLPRQKVYGPVGSSMPVMLPRVIICGRRVLSARASSSEIRTPCTVLLHRRNRGTDFISSLRGSSNCFCLVGMRRLNSCSAEVSSGAAKA